MHELKTPIAKGRLLNAFLESPKERENYDAVFERLELLIEEFAKIERMLSSSYEAKLANYSALDIVEQALELMILDETEMEQKVTLIQQENYRLHTDFELLALAIKNLIDNAIKYAPDHKVTILIDSRGVTISNSGKQFTHSLEPYLEPFHNQNHGLGLGLYIVQNIIQMLSLTLEYHYEEEENRFRITQCSR
jgi:two-component system OmpR family sensor kinase